jgi:hypothetical protein
MAIGAGLSVGAGLLNAYNKSQTDAAERAAEQQAYLMSKNAREAEKARQAQFEQQASNFWNDTADKLAAPQQAANAAAAENNFIQTVNSLPPPGSQDGFLLSGQADASPELQKEIAARTAKATADARARVAALAKLSGYGTAQNMANLALNEDADYLSTINDLRRGSLGVSQFEQTIPAAQVYPGSSALADILSGAGAILATHPIY